MADGRIDPFNVEALEKSLNDSATRVSAIWLSFLVFGLYLLITAAIVDHRQLLLDGPVKLPVVNIDLPLWGFFFLAPILFVIFHAYVLLQLLLLARTASAYNEALGRAALPAAADASMRQRLANTLFAQIFVGSPREREGWLGALLKAMAWITLAIAPILILLAFQFAFLPYHSHLATWMHRLLILLELLAIVVLWPLVLDGRRDFGKLGRRQWIAAVLLCVLFGFFSLSLATFPGEPHLNLFNGHSLSSTHCARWLSDKFDRLDLRRSELFDPASLARLENNGSKEIVLGKGFRTLQLQERNLDCATFDGVDLRRVNLDRSRMNGASFTGTNLEEASLNETQLNEASFWFAWLNRASFKQAALRGTVFRYAAANGATFSYSQLQGAQMNDVSLVAADLSGAQLEGADLRAADLRGAFFVSTALTAADFSGASLQGAYFSETQLQGVNLAGARLDLATFQNALVWQSTGQDCSHTRVIEPVNDPMMAFREDGRPFIVAPNDMRQITAATVRQLIDASTRNITSDRLKSVVERLQKLPVAGSKADNTAPTSWQTCAAQSAGLPEPAFDREHSELMRDIACNSVFHWKSIIEGIVDKWMFDNFDPPDRVDYLGRALLGLDGRECRASKYLGDFLKESVRARLKSDAKTGAEKP